MPTYSVSGIELSGLNSFPSLSNTTLNLVLRDGIEFFRYSIVQTIDGDLPFVDIRATVKELSIGPAETPLTGVQNFQFGQFSSPFGTHIVLAFVNQTFGDTVQIFQVGGDPLPNFQDTQSALDFLVDNLPSGGSVPSGPFIPDVVIPLSLWDNTLLTQPDPTGLVFDPDLPFHETGVEEIGTNTINAMLGGERDDTLSIEDGLAFFDGREGDDLLTGGDGRDSLDGGPGDDTLSGGLQDDTIWGGSGTDTAYINATFGQSTISQTDVGFRIVGPQGNDGYSSVETFRFSDRVVPVENLLSETETSGSVRNGTSANDTLIGTNSDDTISAGEGNDVLAGGEGNDVLDGGGGDDNISSSFGNDFASGGDGRDSMGGGFGNDWLRGEGGNDILGGGRGDDSVEGGDGNDAISGGAGDDTITGDLGNDTIGAGFNNDRVDGGAGHDSLGGGTGRDTLIGRDGNDSIGAGEGDDLISGNAGDDFLAGGGRHDIISGGSGNDRIIGGTGDDTMIGGSGADLFIFNSFTSGDEDLIVDFEDGIDHFRMSGVTGAPNSGHQGRLDALNVTDIPDGVEMSYGGHTIEVSGIQAADLDLVDFIFL